MSTIRIVLQVVMLAMSSLGIATLMEWYKKKIRKDQAKIWEIRTIAGVVSAGVAVLFKVCGVFTPIISYFWPSVIVWVDVLLYAVVIYLFQLYGDMDMVKHVIRIAADAAFESDALSGEIERFIKEFETSTSIKAKDVVKVLLLVGVTKEKLESALEQIGLSDEKAKELIVAYDKAIEPKVEKQ